MGNLISTLRWRFTSSLFSLSSFRRLFKATKNLSSTSTRNLPTANTTTPHISEKPKHILILGGAYAGLSTVVNLQKLLSGAPHQPGPYNLPTVPKLPRTPPRITILDERDGIYHTVGTPLVHTSPDVSTTVPRAWKKFADIPYLRDVLIVQGRVERVDPKRKEVVYTSPTGEKSMAYDYLVCATGLQRDWPAQPRATTKEEYIRDAIALVAGLVDAKERIVVIGGGAVGTEFAGELKLTHPRKQITLIHSRSTLLSSEPLPSEFKTKALEYLRESGVEVLLNTRVNAEVGNGSLLLSTGETINTSAIIWCVGQQHPSTSYLPTLALDKHTGLVRVSTSLTFPATVPNHNAHFAIGDIAQWSGIKRCGTALLMGCFAATNLLLSIVASENGEEVKLAEFPEMVAMLVLALGDKAVMFHPEKGLTHGVEPLVQSFGEDLGLRLCWGCLGIEVDGEKKSG
ncbi:pyridine nucleotide-disulfide oxidoreductase-like protein [Trichophaea hybrida]|nr:pyridine nucleotide-disulfide oxidoreductase-like protein [Trichophaea hybrida]